MDRLVLLHAATRDRHDFTALLSALPDGAPDTLAPDPLAPDPLALDLAGHGEAPRAPRYRIVDFAAAVNTALDAALGADRAILYGHSLGGLVALAVADLRPDKVAGLVMEEPPVFGSMMPRLAESSFYRGFTALRSLMAGEAADWSHAQWEHEVAKWPSGHGRTTVADILGAEGVRMRARQLARLDPNVLDALIAGDLHADFDIAAALSDLTCPAIILAGEVSRNSALSDDDVARIAALTPIAIERVRGEGHFIHETLPEPCVAAIRRVSA